MFINKCSKMKTDLKLTMFNEKLKSVSTEIDELIRKITISDKSTKPITNEEIIEQLREIQDFTNS